MLMLYLALDIVFELESRKTKEDASTLKAMLKARQDETETCKCLRYSLLHLVLSKTR